MAQTQGLKRRIRSVKNAKQITKALEVVAASRMRKVQSAVADSKVYAELAQTIISRVAPSQEAQQHPFFKTPTEKVNKLYVVFSSDRGQAGAFNSNIFRLVTTAVQADRQAGLVPYVVVFGRKGARFFAHAQNINLLAAYENLDDLPPINVFAPVIESIEAGFAGGDFGIVNIVLTQFVSALSQKAQIKQLLPVSLEQASSHEPQPQQPEKNNIVYEFEPNLQAVLDEALRLYFEAQLMQARIESIASEHSMRMIAMGNANRNAGELIDTLTLELNASRQAAITQEIAEITGGAAAIAS